MQPYSSPTHTLLSASSFLADCTANLGRVTNIYLPKCWTSLVPTLL